MSNIQKIIIASGPVIIENNKVLLNKHGEDKFYKFCGGKVENFEHFLFENAQREVMEEMGLEIKLLEKKPFIYLTEKRDPAGKKTADVILFHYFSKRIGEIKPGSEIDRWDWISVEELVDLEKANELAPNIIPALKYFNFI